VEKRIKSTQILTAVFIIIIIGVVLVSVRVPPQTRNTQPLEFNPTKPITITVICPQTSELEAYTLLTKQAETDINKHMREFDQPLEFSFNILDAQGESKTAYDHAYASYNLGYELIVGLSWSSQMDTFFSFAQENGALIISPGSAQPWPWKLAPNTYRLHPADHLYSIPIASAIQSLNISNIIVLKQGEHYANPILDQFKSEYHGNIQIISLDVTMNDIHITEKVEEIQALINEACKNVGPEHVGVYYIGFSHKFNRLIEIYSQFNQYKVPWFVSEWYEWYNDSGSVSGGFNETMHLLGEINLIGCYPEKPTTESFKRINNIYSNTTGSPLPLVHGNLYDGLWITALSVAEAKSIDGDIVGQIVPKVSSNYVGVTGNCSFNEWGDRWGVDWNIYGYYSNENVTKAEVFGLYNTRSREIHWVSTHARTHTYE
jgi:ABC-type branched-subunit amino acid transport system substrate-binding protein